jgi:hypothetical protein
MISDVRFQIEMISDVRFQIPALRWVSDVRLSQALSLDLEIRDLRF